MFLILSAFCATSSVLYCALYATHRYVQPFEAEHVDGDMLLYMIEQDCLGVSPSELALVPNHERIPSWGKGGGCPTRGWGGVPMVGVPSRVV